MGSYWIVQGDRKFRVITEDCGYSGEGKKTAHLRIYDSTLRDEDGAEVEGEAASELRALVKEGVATFILLTNPNSIGSVDIEFGAWTSPASEVTPPPPFRMPWVELAAFVIGLAIAAVWIGAELHLF